MKIIILVGLILIGSFQILTAQSKIIPNFKSAQNQCDYLIVTPSQFITGAENLAKFRQTASGYKTGIILLDSLYSQFDGVGRKTYEKIWYGLKYASTSWMLSPQIIVLIGSDSLAYNFSDSTWMHYGSMPAPVFTNSTPYEINGRLIQPQDVGYSDDYYASLSDTIPRNFQNGIADSEYSVTIGRIPCDSTIQCERYVQKVIDFETRKIRNKSWLNSAMIVSDDTMEGVSQDPLGFTHLDMAEKCADSLLPSWFVTKIVGCRYLPDSSYFKPRAEDSVIAAINQGNIWSIYIGHGSPSLWSDERMLVGSDVSRIHNDSTPSVFVSFSCQNGNYAKNSLNLMCKQFLFSNHGGALVFIGGTTDTYAAENAELMGAFFRTFNKNQNSALGQALRNAKGLVASLNSNAYAFLGDPAISLSNGQINLSLSRNNHNQLSFAAKSNSGASSGNYDVRIYKHEIVNIGGDKFILDSLVSQRVGLYSSNAFSVTLGDTNVRVVAFVWNDKGEGRMDSSFISASLPILAQSKQNPVMSLRVEKTKLFLQTGSLRGSIVRLTALTLNGKTVISKDLSANASEIKIDVKNMGLPAGIYFIKFSTVKGVIMQRVIVAK